MVNVEILKIEIPRRARKALRPLVRDQFLKLEFKVVPRFRRAIRRHMKDVILKTLRDTKLKSRSGRMRLALLNGIRVTGTRMDTIRGAVVGPAYIRAHEYGAKIRPKSARALTVPLPAALRPDGTPKFRKATSWRRYGSFIFTSRRTGQKYIAYKNAQGSLILLYVLVQLTVLEPKLGLRTTFNKMTGALLARLASIVYEEMLRLDIFALLGDVRSKKIVRGRVGQFRGKLRIRTVR